MRITEREFEGIIVLEIAGNITGPPKSSELSSKLSELVEAGENKIILDLAAVDWINSSGIGILMKALHKLRSSNGDLMLARPVLKVKNILQITNFDKIINVFDSIDQAIMQFKMQL
jgi:anti-sigma B factor antagonist